MGFGALLSPLIADPFLSEANCLPANGTANSTSGSHLFHASRVLGQHHAEAWRWSNQSLSRLPPQDGGGTRVSYAFWIMALINVSATRAGLGGAKWTATPASPYQLPVQRLLVLGNVLADVRPGEGKGMGKLNVKGSQEIILKVLDCDNPCL